MAGRDFFAKGSLRSQRNKCMDMRLDLFDALDVGMGKFQAGYFPRFQFVDRLSEGQFS